MLDFSKKMTIKQKEELADILLKLSETIGFRISSRGWCYQLEQERYINKNQFNKVEESINKCIKLGLLPIDFVADEDARKFDGIEIPDKDHPLTDLKYWLNHTLDCENHYSVDWWKGEKYYIQVVVEKIDLKTLFSPITEKYHIPIATSRGWGSILQRGDFTILAKESPMLQLWDEF